MTQWLRSTPAKLRTALANIGLLDHARDVASRPLADHIDGAEDLPGFHQSLIAKGATDRYISVVMSRVRRILTGCGCQTWRDIHPSKAPAFQHKSRKNGLS